MKINVIIQGKHMQVFPESTWASIAADATTMLVFAAIMGGLVAFTIFVAHSLVVDFAAMLFLTFGMTTQFYRKRKYEVGSIAELHQLIDNILVENKK